MTNKLIETLRGRTLLADGGLASEIYARGFFINRCYDELNLSAAKVIGVIHKEFADAGAEIVTANTFGANRIALTEHGLQDKIGDINRAGVELAREAAGDEGFVLGAMGPLAPETFESEPADTIRQAYAEQARALLDGGADALYLESFPTLDTLKIAFEAAAGAADGALAIPSLVCDAFQNSELTPSAAIVEDVSSWGAPVLGINGGGPEETLDLLPGLVSAAGGGLKFFVRPCAGNPRRVAGRLLYMASPEYMAEFARRFMQKGAAIVGGDSGITPRMIREMNAFIRSIQPGAKVSVSFEREELPEEGAEPAPIPERTPFGKVLGQKFAISVELDPPKGLDATKSVEGAKFLYENGIDAVNIADGPRAIGRMSPTALALLVRQSVPIEPIIHVCCRDRNVLALQMDLISANALGLRNLMLITGDPPKMGMYPDATAVFDFDAIGLVYNANLLNHGLDFAKRPLGGQTSFLLGIGCNPGAVDMDLEAERYAKKVEAGAEYVFSQPVYDSSLLFRFLDKIKHVRPIPFFVGILPLASYKNAEFLHNNVPGMQVPDGIRERMRKAPTKQAQREKGVEIAAEALGEAKDHPAIKGAYIFPPFGRYAGILDVLEKSGVR